MKKIFGVALAWFLVSTVSIAQTTSNQIEVAADKSKTCIPTKECAKKAGVSLEECKKICSSKSTATASTSQVASASLVSETNEVKKACTAKNGTAECKAKCASKSKTAMNESSQDNNTKVAAAKLVNEIEEIPSTDSKTKKCCTGPSSCKKKKG